MHQTAATSHGSPDKALRPWEDGRWSFPRFELNPFSASLSEPECASPDTDHAGLSCVQSCDNSEAASVIPNTTIHTSFATAPNNLRRPLRLRESVGLIGTLSIVGGSLGVVAVLMFLALLWFGHGPVIDGAQANQVWRRIAIGAG